MIRHANDGPDGTSDGAHARGFEKRQWSADWWDRSDFYQEDEPQRDGAIVLDTRDEVGIPRRGLPRRTVRPTASWADGAAPTLGLTVSGTGDESFSVDQNSNVPDLGTGWNGVELSKTVPTGRTAYAIVYSDIQKASGGTPDELYMTLGAWVLLPDDPAAAVTEYDMGVFADGHINGNGISDNPDLDLDDTATYRGPATGLYTRATYSGSGDSRALESAKVGSFTATATINVDWSGPDRLNGSITNFRENGESLGDWTIDLGEASNEDGHGPSGSGSPSNPLARGDYVTGQAGDLSLNRGQWTVGFYTDLFGGGLSYAAGVFTVSNSWWDNNILRIAGAFAATR